MQLLPRRLRSLHIAGDAIAATKLFQTRVERAAAFEAAIVRRCGGADAALERSGGGVAVADECRLAGGLVLLALLLGEALALFVFALLARALGRGFLGAALRFDGAGVDSRPTAGRGTRAVTRVF